MYDLAAGLKLNNGLPDIFFEDDISTSGQVDQRY
jgi:hypothetical protein